MMPHEFENAIYTLRAQSTSQENPRHSKPNATPTTFRDEEATRPCFDQPNLTPIRGDEEETRMYLELSEAIISPPEHIYECPI